MGTTFRRRRGQLTGWKEANKHRCGHLRLQMPGPCCLLECLPGRGQWGPWDDGPGRGQGGAREGLVGGLEGLLGGTGRPAQDGQ